MRSICYVPARMGSSRFPGKPLVPVLGLPLVLHVAHRCRLSTVAEDVVVATCDDEIRAASEAAGFITVMTRDDHDRCTDRVEEAVSKLAQGLDDDDLVIMVQGDEIMVSPDMIDNLHAEYLKTGSPVINLVSRLYDPVTFDDPNVVKVVAAPDNRALYFSRSAIPSGARAPGRDVYQQTGVIALQAAFLMKFGQLPQTPLEITESVDMLRVLEHGYNIRLVKTETETLGIDTPAERDRAETLLASDPVTAKYLKLGV